MTRAQLGALLIRVGNIYTLLAWGAVTANPSRDTFRDAAAFRFFRQLNADVPSLDLEYFWGGISLLLGVILLALWRFKPHWYHRAALVNVAWWGTILIGLMASRVFTAGIVLYSLLAIYALGDWLISSNGSLTPVKLFLKK